jgi:hypothetical protein
MPNHHPSRSWRGNDMPYKSGQVSVCTSATLIATPGSVPENDGILVSSSAAAFIGPAGVTTTTGFPLSANTPVLVPTIGATSEGLYAVVRRGTATVSYIYPG